MLDSLELFEEISQNEFLENTEFILFLNKHDLFVEKLKTSKLSSCFPDYEGKRKSVFFFLKGLNHVFGQLFCINSASVFSARLNVRRHQTSPILMQRIDANTDVIDKTVFKLEFP